MKWFNGKTGVIGAVSAVVVLVGGLFTLYFSFSDRVSAKVDTAKQEAIEESVATARAEDEKIWRAQNQNHEKNSLRFWMQQRDIAAIELKRIRRGLRHHPNDAGLLEDKEYWQEMYDKAKEELDKILNP